MKKILSIFLIGIFFAGCSGNTGGESTENNSTDTNTEVTEDVSTDEDATVAATDTGEIKEVIIGLDDSFAPMGFREDGELVGFDIDLATAVFEEAGVKYTFQPINWNTKELELSSGKIDCIWNGLTITPEREENMLFTKPYLLNNQLVFVKANSEISTKADLAGKIIGAQAGSSSVDALKKDEETFASLAELSEYDTNVNAFLDLDIGRVDAVICDEVVGRYYAENLELSSEIIVLDENFGEEEYGIATRLDDTVLNELISKNLAAVIENGKGTEISTKWFGEDILEK